MAPSSIRRDPGVPLRTRVLDNGTLVVENAYEGTLYIGNVPVADIKGISVKEPEGGRPSATATRDA